MKYPILYAKNATDFFNMGLGPLKTAITATVTEERNGIFIFEATVIVDDEIFPLIEEDGIIKADAGHLLKDQRFRIKRIIPNEKNQATIYAEHVSYLAEELSLKPESSVAGSGYTALAQWKSSIIDSNPFIVTSDVATEGKTSWRIDKVQNARQALGGVAGSILDVWGGEYRFDNYHVSLLKKRGTTAQTLLAYGRNIKTFEQERNIIDTYNSVYPYAIYTDDEQEEHLVTATGYFIDAENIGSFPNRKSKPVDFSSEFENDEIPTSAKLIELAKSYITENAIGTPKVSIKVSFVDLSKSADYAEIAPLEEVNLCDDVRIVYPKLNVDTIAKVIRTAWNVMAESYDEIEIGEKRASLSNVINDQATAIKEASDQSGQALVSANGKNTNFYGLFGENGLGEPTATKIGDLWFKPNGEYTEMYQWDGTIWKFIMSDKETEEVKKAVEEAQEGIKEATESANNAVDKANQANETAGFANDGAEQAKEIANEAGAVANTAKENANNAISEAGKATGIANTAKENAEKAIADAGKTTAEMIEVKEIAGALQTDLAKTKTDLTAGLVESEKKINAVADDLTTAEKALSDSVGTVSQKLTSEVTRIDGTLTEKASVTTVNGIKGTVETQGLEIAKNTAGIALKADKTTVDTISKTVSKQGAAIDVNAEGIATKASQSSVNSLTGRVSTAEAGITNNATQISLRASKTELDTVAGRVSTAEAGILVNAGAIKLKADESKLNSVTGEVTKNTAELGVQAGKISGLVSENTSQGSRLTAVEQTANGLEVNVAKVAVDLADVGIYNAWAWSKDGTDRFTTVYPGDNLLLDTGFNNLPQYWTARAEKVTGTFNGHNVIYYDSKTITDDFTDVLQQTIYDPTLTNNRVLPSHWYTLSFYAKGVGQMHTYAYGSFVDDSARCYIDGVESGYAVTDGNHKWDLTDDWKRHTYTFKSKSSFPATGVQKVLWRLFKGNEAYICMPKLDEGTLATPYTPAPSEDPVNAYPTFVGRSIKKSDKPSDYVWEVNPDVPLKKAWAWSVDGTDRFTTVYPGENLLPRSKFETMDGWSPGFNSYSLSNNEITLIKPAVFSSRAFLNASNSLTSDKNKKYSAQLEIYISSDANNISGSTLFLRSYSSTGGAQDFSLAEIGDNAPKETWFRITTPPMTPPSTSDESKGLNYTLAVAANAIGTFKVRKPKAEVGSPTIYTPAPSEDYANAYPTYVGTSSKFSSNPADYKWELSDVNFATTTELANLSVNVDEIAQTVTKNKTDADDKITNLQAQQTVTANAVTTKANSSTVDTLTNRVTTAEGKITTQAGQIALKASTADVNTLTGKVTSNTGALTVASNQIAGLLTKTNGHDTQITEMKADASGIKNTVATVRSDLDGMEVGDRNLLIGTKDFSGGNTGAGTTKLNGVDGYNGNTVLKSVIPTGATYTDTYLSKTSIIPDGLQYTAIFFAKTDVDGTLISCYFYEPNTTVKAVTSQGRTTTSKNGDIQFSLTTAWKLYWVTWTQTATIATKNIILGRIFSGAKPIYLTKPIFVSGNVPKDWTPAPEDQVTVTDFTEYQQTVDGFKSTVNASITNLNAVDNALQTASDGLKATTINLQSQQTQTAGEVKTVLAKTTENASSIASVKLTADSLKTTLAEVEKITNWQVKTGAQDLDTYTTQGKYFFSSTTLTNSPAPGCGYLVVEVGMAKRIVQTYQRDNDNALQYQRINNGEWSEWKQIANGSDITNLTTKFTTMEQNLNGFKSTVNSDISGLKTTQTQLAGQITTTATDLTNKISSQSTQLTNAINLRVTKGDVISQINLEAGRALISADKLYLDATTVTFSGKAFIPTAAITSLSADKINTGTLNAANVNIINLNAKSVTSGEFTGLTLSGPRFYISLVGGYLRAWDDAVELRVGEGALQYSGYSNVKKLAMASDGMTLSTVSGYAHTGLRIIGGEAFLDLANAGNATSYARLQMTDGHLNIINRSTGNIRLQPAGATSGLEIYGNGSYMYLKYGKATLFLNRDSGASGSGNELNYLPFEASSFADK